MRSAILYSTTQSHLTVNRGAGQNRTYLLVCKEHCHNLCYCMFLRSSLSSMYHSHIVFEVNFCKMDFDQCTEHLKRNRTMHSYCIVAIVKQACSPSGNAGMGSMFGIHLCTCFASFTIFSMPSSSCLYEK